MTQTNSLGFEIETSCTACDSACPAGPFLTRAHHQTYSLPYYGATSRLDPFIHEFDGGGWRFYTDHKHAEMSSPLCLSARELTRKFREGRRKLTRIIKAAEKTAGPLRVSFNNTSRSGKCWAFHVNVLINRKTFDDWREQEWSPLLPQWVPLLATSPPLFGAGKLGSENDTPAAVFQTSQRADLISKIAALETVETKSLINERDQALSDPGRFARFHIAGPLDCTLNDFQNFIKFGILQLMIALLEEGCPLPSLRLEDPVEAIKVASRDMSFNCLLPLKDGRRVTALDIQEILAVSAARSVGAGKAGTGVPDAGKIVSLWIETIDFLRRGHPRLIRRLDWVTRLNTINEVKNKGGLSRDQMRVVDWEFSVINGGIFEALERELKTDRLEGFLGVKRPGCEVSPRELARMWLISHFGEYLELVDWHYVIVRAVNETLWKIDLDDPFDDKGVVQIVNDAENWDDCLFNLVRCGLAKPVIMDVEEIDSITNNVNGGDDDDEQHETIGDCCGAVGETNG